MSPTSLERPRGGANTLLAALAAGGLAIGGVAVTNPEAVPFHSESTASAPDFGTGTTPGLAPLPYATQQPSATTSEVPNTAETQAPETDLGLADPVKKKRAAAITSSFENSTTEIQYSYAEDIDDGRGITAGRDGYTSGTSDLLMVVERTVEKNPNSILKKYLGALQKDNNTNSTAGLGGFVKDWETASTTDPTLNEVQDEIHDELYFNPAMKRAQEAGIKTSLGQLIILDTIIQHGEGDDVDGLPYIMKQVLDELGPVKDNEKEWLKRFLDVRKQHLNNAADPDTRKGWRDSVSRVTDGLEHILASGNMALDLPIEWSAYGDHFQLDS
jgi:chitosanase